MIGLIEKNLKKYGLIAGDARYSYNIYRRGEIVYFLFFENGDQFAVKISEVKSLKKEYESTREAFNTLKHHLLVPEPLIYFDESGVSSIISRGIRFAPVSMGLIHRYPKVFTAGINEYIDRSREKFKVSAQKETHSDMVDKLAASFSGCAISTMLQEWLSLFGDEKLNSIEHVKQHGDFAVTNIGISSSHLSIIDWEDFGSLTLPGIDILMLCASFLDMEEAKVERLLYQKEPHNLSELINYFCAVYGLQYELFLELAPLYFTNFLYLKKKYGYGKEIVDQVEKIALSLFTKIIKEKRDDKEIT